MTITCSLMGGLGNQLFQIFATMAHGIYTNQSPSPNTVPAMKGKLYSKTGTTKQDGTETIGGNLKFKGRFRRGGNTSPFSAFGKRVFRCVNQKNQIFYLV